MRQACFDQGSIAVIPVPLYKAKRRQRGFNQAELIAAAALKVYPARERLQLALDLSAAHTRHAFADRPDQPPAASKSARGLCGGACRRSHWPRRSSRG